MATTKFGFRQWSSQGNLQTEYWISDIDLGGRRDSTPHTLDQPDEREVAIHFTAGSLQGLYNNDIYTTSLPRHAAGNTGTLEQDLILALKTGTQPARRYQGWRNFFSPSRKRPAESSYPSSSISTSSPSPSIESSMADVKQNRLSALAASPNHDKRPGFLSRHFGHHRRQSSLNGARSDAQQSPPQSRPSTAARQASQQPAPQSPAVQAPILTNGNTLNTEDAQEIPGISVRAPTGISDQFPEVHYPDGLPTPLSTKSAKGIKWAENYDEQSAPRPRRTSSAATHGRRSSIYSKAAEGDYYAEGVDTGVGSKARRLSVALLDELVVDEEPLDAHFSTLSRIAQKEIGSGGAAVVRLMKSKTAGNGQNKVVAVKEFRPRDPDEESQYDYERKIKSEFAISKACQHPNVVETYRLCYSKDGLWYHIMQFCEVGDLNDLITNTYLSREDRNCMMKQLVRGVDYLHSRGIAHRDLKSENLLVTNEGCLKIADFGTGEVFAGVHPGVRKCRRQSIVDMNEPIRKCAPGWVGSRPYMAPEIYQRLGPYDPRAVDVWSCGIVYLTLCFGGNPWDCASPDCKNYSIYCNTWDDWACKFPDEEIKKGRPLPGFVATKNFKMLDDPGTKTFVMGMLHPNPDKRWSIREVLDCQTVHEYACCQQDGYSDDIKTRQKKAAHNHKPPEKKGHKFLKTGS
ncbi:Serine/threonine-protein kinase hal4 [Pseudocercospora fuligena]|uniref:Serine/threonine-protein kinase hal4 n=1 Tax=Pseudocercospora fuligena TaxID=685502 RepID=A0A8H6RCS5_9PEZI|nr:Serine/threonine-protein kinase hal4 [Pseudocercospora fuligena]